MAKMRTPRVNDIIRTVYGEGKEFGYVIREVVTHLDGTLAFCCLRADGGGRNLGGYYFLNGYRMVDGRCLGEPIIPGSAMWRATGGAEDEIFIDQFGEFAGLPLFNLMGAQQ